MKKHGMILPVECGGIAQLARALGSYPGCHWFEASRRYHSQSGAGSAALGNLKPLSPGAEPDFRQHRYGALVKRLRHRPFTAVIRVRFPYASPPRKTAVRRLSGTPNFIWRRSSAGRALASHARGHRFEFCRLHHQKTTNVSWFSFLYCTARRGTRVRTSR